MPEPKPEPKKDEPKEKPADYSDAKFLDEQIAMAETELHRVEMESAARINFLRGTVNTLQAFKDKKAVVTKEPPGPAAQKESTTERPGG